MVYSKERGYEKSTSEQKYFYFKLSSKNNVDILGITVSMWKQHDFETIFNSNNIMNIQYTIGKGFGYRERADYMGVNDYFGPMITNIPHATPNYGPGKSIFGIYHYRQTYCSPEKLSRIVGKSEKQGQGVMYYPKISILNTWSLLVMKHVTN